MDTLDSVRVYVCKYDDKLEEAEFEEYLGKLPAALKEQISRFHRWQDRHRSLFGKLLLKRALEELDRGFDLSHLRYTKFHRPFIDLSFDFNISHSGQYVVCALSTIGNIGVDTERIQPLNLWDFKNFFSAEEFNRILGANEKYNVFFDYWTMKEAVLKAHGTGFSVLPICVRLNGKMASLKDNLWYLYKMELDPGYALHIASNTEITEKIDVNVLIFN